MSEKLPDEVLAALLADCERRLDHWRKHGAQVEDDPGVGCDTVIALVREVQRLRVVEREHYASTHCHCGRGLTAWSEPACDGCRHVPENCHCAPLPSPSGESASR